MRVLMIGGTSFIGPHVVRSLISDGHEVTVFHRGEHEPELPRGVRHVHSASAAFPVLSFPPELISWKPDVVLHMVAMGERDSEAVVRAFTGVAQRLVVPSSGDVYGAYGVLIGSETESGPSELLREDSPLRKNLYPYRKMAKGPEDWIYHYDKILVERVVMSDPELPATILRLPAVYGPGDNRHGISAHLKRMDDQRPAILLDDKQAGWRWSHGYVENVAAAIMLAVTDDRAAGRIYNVGEESVPTTAERIRTLAKLVGWPGEIVALPQERFHLTCKTPTTTPRIWPTTLATYATNSAIRKSFRWTKDCGAPLRRCEKIRSQSILHSTITPLKTRLSRPGYPGLRGSIKFKA
jgi:nucleoside-diphosphate-sugar epimerase